MKALTAVAAVAYVVGLWMFAPQSRWEQSPQRFKIINATGHLNHEFSTN